MPGQYRSLADFNMNFQVSSVRPAMSEPVATTTYVTPAPNAYTPEQAYRDGYQAGMRDRPVVVERQAPVVVQPREERHWWRHDDD